MKHLIKFESTANGVLGVSHVGKDQQYCEAGEQVILKWQPDAKWGLQEAHYTDGDGNVTAIDLTTVKVNGKDVVVFTMPDANITIGGTFKRFVIEDWMGRDAAFSIVGSFDVANLPNLDGFNDAGKVAFVKDTRKYATWDGYGWTYMDGKPVTPRYLTFTANEDGSSVGFWYYSENATVVDAGKQVEYSTDGVTWQPYIIGNADNDETPAMISLDKGESVMFRGINQDGLAFYIEDDADYEWLAFVINGSIAANGDVTSLINGVGGDVTLAEYCYYGMFNGCTGLTQAPALPATTLANSCYNNMFNGCTGLTQAPALPATTLANSCYSNMFNGCTGLTQAPVLPATTLANSCYSNMFNGCTGLTQAPVLPATTLANYCYNYMFSGCTSLTQAPVLPATTLTTNCYERMFFDCTGLTQAPALPATTLEALCYSNMFNGCTSLTQAPALPATTLAAGCYEGMFDGCTGLTQAPALPATTLATGCYNNMFRGCMSIVSHNVATLNHSEDTFKNNSSCASLTIHAATPPTIASNTITGLKAECVIYVPAASVDAYKAKQYWSARASYIQAIP